MENANQLRKAIAEQKRATVIVKRELMRAALNDSDRLEAELGKAIRLVDAHRGDAALWEKRAKDAEHQSGWLFGAVVVLAITSVIAFIL